MISFLRPGATACGFLRRRLPAARLAGRFARPAALTAVLLLTACGHQAIATPPPTAAVPTATTAPAPTETSTPAPVPASSTPAPAATSTADPKAPAIATENARQALAVDHLGAGNTLLAAGNLNGAVHEYATARALAPTRPDVASAAATAQALVAATAEAAIVPVRLQIPAIGVSAPVEILGLTPDGAMEAPEGWWDAGWYKYGPRPGQTGNAVMAGHLDSTTGPALFWHLTALGAGAKVLVTLSNGQTENFVVQRQVSYADDNAPLQQIFGPTTAVDLNLITCGGIWNPFQRNYSNRTVVYTTRA